MTYLLVRDHGADAEKDDSYKGGENVGRNVGVLIGAIAAIIILSPLMYVVSPPFRSDSLYSSPSQPQKTPSKTPAKDAEGSRRRVTDVP